MNWKKNFEKENELILCTSSKNKPNANIVISLGFIENKLLIADCQMKTTIKNIKENKNICIISQYLRAKGTGKIYNSGKYFELAKEKTKDYKVKNAILITINKVFDLDKGKILFKL